MAESINSLLSVFHLNNELGILVLIGLVFITVLHKVLGRIAFMPALEHIEHRESATEGARFSAGQMRSKAEALNARYQEALLQARIEGNKERLKIVGKAKAEAAAIISEAEGAAAQTVGAARQRLSNEIEAAHTVIEREAVTLADMLATRVDTELTRS